ncbi:MAG: AAA family ATPase [Cyclobacteriaceae bacterium]|nr:AAA family ATPase [Cyclobacteriaceae bacterium]
MFRLISLIINDWTYLGHIPEGSLEFVPKDEIKKTELPYTTVLIGVNGTGKSTLLSYIAKIFEDLKFAKDNNGKRNSTSISFPYSVCYQIGKTKFQVTRKSQGLDFEAFKQDKRRLKWIYNVSINEKPISDLKEIELPEQVIAVSYLPMDRFRQKRNLPDDFYQYLGLRHRSNAASPQYFLNNTLPLLFNYISESKSVKFLKDILSFMAVDQNYLGLQLEYRYKKFFFTGQLSTSKFQELFENTKQFSEREGTSFAVEYYDRYLKQNTSLIDRIVKYLNVRSQQDNISVGKKSLLKFNLFDNLELIEELSLIKHLQKLDLLTSASLLFRKSENIINSQNLSSGEFHFLTTMIAIQSTLKENSLVLIDEPDTSLHPNWQMKYVHNLKKLFKKWNSTHFVMATHSHFIISDLENESSEIIGLKGQVPNVQATPLNLETYGWSPDEILYKVFELRTTRNYFFELDLLSLAKQLSSETKDYDEIKRIVNKLKKYTFSKEDPLNKLILSAENILTSNDKS